MNEDETKHITLLSLVASGIIHYGRLKTDLRAGPPSTNETADAFMSDPVLHKIVTALVSGIEKINSMSVPELVEYSNGETH